MAAAPVSARPQSAMGHAARASQLDQTQREALLERTKIKDPTLAAVAGFILPFIGAIYTGRWGIAFLFLILEPIADCMVVPSVGIFPLAYRGIAAYLCHEWAKGVNLLAMDEMLKKQS